MTYLWGAEELLVDSAITSFDITASEMLLYYCFNSLRTSEQPQVSQGRIVQFQFQTILIYHMLLQVKVHNCKKQTNYIKLTHKRGR